MGTTGLSIGPRPSVDFSERGRRPVGSGVRLILVGFQDQDNLGLRYLSAAARHHGHDCRIVSYDRDPSALLREVRATEPALVGFSLIFQYMAPEFARVIEALRTDGYAGHVTMGGHYPSFDPAEVLQRMPGLDSVVRYEGEVTLCELLACLERGRDWRGITGIAHRQASGDVVVNPHRQSVDPLDQLPRPRRDDVDYEEQVLPTASMLGSRGCPWNCSFCSIRPFYEAQGGKLRRLREPAAVVEEMLELHQQRGVLAFLFQDDDFLATGRRARSWAIEMAEHIAASEMRGRIALKMSCRSDEVHHETLRTLRDLGGLSHVYLGVESGDDEGLVHLNKQLRAETHLRAGAILRDLGLSFDFGFMLLEPYSEIDHVRHNIAFLEQFVGDGWTVATFCRTLPYAGTPLRDQLEQEQRLLGTPFDPDYRFLDPRLDVFYDWLLPAFHVRNFTDEGLCHLLRCLQFELNLRLPTRRPATDAERRYGRYLTAVCNRVALYSLRSALDHIVQLPENRLRPDDPFLIGLAAHELREERQLTAEVAGLYRALRPQADMTPDALAGGFQKTWTLATPSGMS